MVYIFLSVLALCICFLIYTFPRTMGVLLLVLLAGIVGFHFKAAEPINIDYFKNLSPLEKALKNESSERERPISEQGSV